VLFNLQHGRTHRKFVTEDVVSEQKRIVAAGLYTEAQNVARATSFDVQICKSGSITNQRSHEVASQHTAAWRAMKAHAYRHISQSSRTLFTREAVHNLHARLHVERQSPDAA
jgi:hypothetical protein